MFALTIVEGFAFSMLGFDCSFVTRSGDLSSSSPWSHALPKMAAAMAGRMASLFTLGIPTFYSGSLVLGLKPIDVFTLLSLFDVIIQG